MKPSEFLSELWGPYPPGKILIWITPPKLSSWYTSYENVDQDVEELAAKNNVYTGIGLAASNATVSPRKRVTSDNIAAIPGLWADIDVSHPVHKKENLAPTMEAATEALDTLYYNPTILVNSGHGLQAWWLFERPWILSDHTERALAQSLSQWWHLEILQLMQKEGWTVDATHDLARVMRVPDTFNRKSDPVKVTIESDEGPRFDRNEFLDRLQSPSIFVLRQPTPADHRPANLQDPFAPNDKQATQTDAEQITYPPNYVKGQKGSLILSRGAQPPTPKLMAMLENDPKFRASWEMRRTDFANKSSPSEYDFSLASMALHAEWTDQEVVDLLIAWRSKHNHDLKLREDYYLTTIAKAKAPITQTNAQNKLEATVRSRDQQPSGPEIIEILTSMFNIGIRKIIKYEGDPPTYSMQTDKGFITLGQVTCITSQIQFRNAVAAATGILIPKCKDREWDARAQAVLSACETVDMGESSHPSQETYTWLHDYLNNHSPSVSLDQAIPTKTPFRRNDSTYIFLDHFRKWVEFTTNTHLTSHAMGRRLADCSATVEAVPCTVGQKRTTRSCWRLA